MWAWRECELVLHDGALAAATVRVALVHVHLLGGTAIRSCAWCAASDVAVVFADLADDVVESVLNVDARLGRCLDEFASEAASEFLALCRGCQSNGQNK